jgi:hypothetical protein
MTNEEIETMEAIRKYQNCDYLHPLTCGNDSRHALLKPIEKDGKIILVCPDCDYVQNWHPEVEMLKTMTNDSCSFMNSNTVIQKKESEKSKKIWANRGKTSCKITMTGIVFVVFLITTIAFTVIKLFS